MFDWAIAKRQLEVANAIIERYDVLTGGSLQKSTNGYGGADYLKEHMILQAFQFISRDQPQDAIKLIKKMKKEDLEKQDLAVVRQFRLFDWAVAERQLEVANAIIEQYALETQSTHLKKLAIDYDSMSSNGMRYFTNNVGCGGDFYLRAYSDLVDEQKDIYLKEIENETRTLRIMGVKKLLKITRDPEKRTLAAALESYQKNTWNKHPLDQAIEAAIKSLDEESKETNTFKKGDYSIKIADTVDRKCAVFRFAKHSNHPSLDDFKQEVDDVLNHSAESLFLKKSQSFGETLAAIGNKAARYTGVGYVIAAAKGKFQEFHEYTPHH